MTCKYLIIKNNEPNICKLTKGLCAEEEGDKCDRKEEADAIDNKKS